MICLFNTDGEGKKPYTPEAATGTMIQAFTDRGCSVKEIPGVSRHQSLEMTFRQTVLSVTTYAGTPRELPDAVLVRPFESFGINIDEVSDNHLHIMLIPR